MRRAAALLACLSLAAPDAGAAPDPLRPDEPDMIRYHVRLPQRQAHRVSMSLDMTAAEGGVELAMAVWTPGSYLVREYARHVLDLRAHDADGNPLPVRKLRKNAWLVAGSGPITVEYELYANEQSVRTNHVDDAHAFLAPAATFLFEPGVERAYEVRVDAPAGWTAYTGLPRRGDAYLASDLDVLLDSPFEIGPHRETSFQLRGVPHRVVVAGKGDFDVERLRDDLAVIAAETASIFDQMPFDDYTFIVGLTDGAGGGLEHLNSSVSFQSRWKLDEKGWRSLLSLLAHEYFHAWNVKRFRPAALGPFDYESENYTTDLWVAEGITSYYDDLIPLRAGFYDKLGTWMSERARDFRTLHDTPGARRTSLTESSWDAWIKLYRPDENSVNSTVSYYSKGALVALLLDLRIRRATGGERTLADALRLGWERYTAKGVGYPDGAMLALTSKTADTDLADFFAAYVDGTEPLDANAELAFVGLQLQVTPDKNGKSLPVDEQGFKLQARLGVETTDAGGLCKLTRVLEDGPAYAAGLNVDDLLLAVDGVRVTNGTLRTRLAATQSEPTPRPVTITFYRGESLREIELRPAMKRLEAWKLTPLDDADDAQRAAFQAWTGHELPGGDNGNGDAPDDEQDDRAG